jgi:rare lipoprotein A (peptidoglycan hydrolase)
MRAAREVGVFGSGTADVELRVMGADPTAVVAVTIQPADREDTQSYEQTLSAVLENLTAVTEQIELPEQVLCELVADRGYHSAAVLKREGRAEVVTALRRDRQQDHRRHPRGQVPLASVGRGASLSASVSIRPIPYPLSF